MFERTTMGHSASIVDSDSDFRRVMDLLSSGHFNQFEAGLFDNIMNAILSPEDPWMIAADFRSYVDTQEQAAKANIKTIKAGNETLGSLLDIKA